MRLEVEKYYDTTFGGVSGFVQAGRRRGIDPESIRKACEIVYDGLKPGDTIVSIGQRVHTQARLLEKELIHSQEKRLSTIEQRIEKIESSTLLSRLARFYKTFVNLGTYDYYG